MSWFENQIEERRSSDEQMLEDALDKVSSVVLGSRYAERIIDDRIVTKNSVDEILKYYHYKPVDFPDFVKGIDEQLDYCIRPYGLMYRKVELEEKWYKDAFGPILAFMKEDGLPVALIPEMISGYSFKNPKTGRRERLNAKTSTLFDNEAICFYRPLPQKELGIQDLLLYMKQCVTPTDIALLVLLSFAITLVGLIIPRITKILTGPVLTGGHQTALIGIGIAIICVTLSSQLLTNIQALLQTRLETKTSIGVQASMMMRLLSLPASFFHKFSPGELKSRSMSVGEICSLLLGIIMSTGLTSLVSLLYITQIITYAPSLVVPSMVIILVTVFFSVISTVMQIRIDRRVLEYDAKESGMSYGMITGVQKIKLSGAEKRAFAKWLNLYSKGAELIYNPPLFIKINDVIFTAISLISTIVLYYMAVQSGIDQSSYFAFIASYGMLYGAFMSVSSIALSVARIQPILEMAEPILKAVPETADDKEIVTDITGSIDLDRVSFRYSEDAPFILKDLSLSIKPGEYVAIVGKTGCGKSTLVRLLLGFEKPEKGTVSYDRKSITNLDLPSLRKKIGTVMQEGGLFQGDIYSNIVISAPDLTMEDAWEAAEMADIADDIREMPMGMHTMISERHGGISGGQRQRLMIARAIAPKPKILIFDEATSALDNKTQKQISETLDKMGCTRIVIAHRLSTIMNCDRILVLDGGSVVEDGTYDELIAKGGFFKELVERQRLDTETLTE